jgi:phospholipase C
MKRSITTTGTALFTTAVTALTLMGFGPAFAGNPAAPEPSFTLATNSTSLGATYATGLSQPSLTTAQKIALLQQHVKYVFVLFQENRSFDHYFGTYPGANGLTKTYPGANSNDIYAQPATAFGSYNSVIQNVDGSYSTISPFLIPRTIVNQSGQTVNLYPEDTYSVDHSHAGYINDMHADGATLSVTKNDGYALDQEGLHYASDASGTTATIVNNSNNMTPTVNPSLQTKQKGEVVMSHVDCDTIPFLWQLADRFTLFDNYHQTATGPSTPNAISMIAGQVGDTQWVKHPTNVNSKNTTTSNGPGTTLAPSGIALTLPNLTDSAPYPGSTKDTASSKPPYGPDEASNAQTVGASGNYTSATPQINLTFATVPLSFMGSQVGTITHADEHPATDLIDVASDIQAIAVKNPYVQWAWYQQGYGPEPFDGTTITENGDSTTNGLPNECFGLNYGDLNPNYPTSGSLYCGDMINAPLHASYIVHHNGPQYFGYLGDNTIEQGNLKSLNQFYVDVTNRALPAAGGVFYVRGGYYNNDGLRPIDPNTNVQGATAGNDDHPNYSDAQISETLVADSINAIANSPYWAESVIIVTYDESDGLYDHQPEAFRTYGPDGLPETGGPRIPTIIISPFSNAHTVSHVYSEHSSIIKFLDEIFNLTPLGNLPAESAARTAGATLCSTQPTFCAPNSTPQTNLGPGDTVSGMGDLLEAFDYNRLQNPSTALPASYAMLPNPTSLPHYSGAGCTALSITPTDYPSGYGVGLESDPPPADFNPRPIESPGTPKYNTAVNTYVLPPSDTNASDLQTAEQGSGGPWPN